MTLEAFTANLSESHKQRIKDICFIDKLSYEASIKQIYDNIYNNSRFLNVEFEIIVDELQSK